MLIQRRPQLFVFGPQRIAIGCNLYSQHMIRVD